MTSVSIATAHARRLVELETRRSGSTTKAAIRSVATRLREPPGSVWSLLYRAPKRISADLFHALEAAVEREIRREIGAHENELATLKSGCGRLDPRKIAEVEAGLARLKSSLRQPDCRI